MRKELLAPAGDFETLMQAIHHGADAIYLGGKKFGARKFAANFDEEEMVRAIHYCHLYGVRIYVTVNTMIYEEELDEALEYVSFLYQNSVDAIIVQDLGLINRIRKEFPSLEIHASTQLHNHNVEGLYLLEKLGVKRVVVAREMSLQEIEALDTTMEIECFIHGALCVCYSGQCLFSSLLFSRSGNRGACAGICRLSFQLLEDGRPISTDGNYLLSPRELNTMGHIDELMGSKITSFKIEGRMKAPTTIGFIVSLYRRLIDMYEGKKEAHLTEGERKHLLALFNREFTDGYLFHTSVSNFMNIKSPNHIGYPIGRVVSIVDQKIEISLFDELTQEDGIRFLESESGMIVNFLYDKNSKLIHSSVAGTSVLVDCKVPVQVGDTVMKTLDRKLLKRLEKYPEKRIPITINVVAHYPHNFIMTVSDSQNTVTKEGDFLEIATKIVTTRERVIAQLKRTGNTPFLISDVKVEMDTNLFIPIVSLNEIRREAFNELISIREGSTKNSLIRNISRKDSEKSTFSFSNSIVYTALVRNEEQLVSCIRAGIQIFYTPSILLYRKYKSSLSIYYRLERVNSKYPIFCDEHLLATELGSIYRYSKNNEVVSDYFLNVANTSMLKTLSDYGVQRVTLSIECSTSQVQSILKQSEKLPEIEILLYGHVEVMITKYCPLSLVFHKEKGNCDCCRNGKRYALRDRNGATYPILFSNGLTHIFYHTPVMRDMDSYLRIGVRCFRFEFLNETGEEVEAIIKKLKKEL